MIKLYRRLELAYNGKISFRLKYAHYLFLLAAFLLLWFYLMLAVLSQDLGFKLLGGISFFSGIIFLVKRFEEWEEL